MDSLLLGRHSGGGWGEFIILLYAGGGHNGFFTLGGAPWTLYYEGATMDSLLLGVHSAMGKPRWILCYWGDLMSVLYDLGGHNGFFTTGGPQFHGGHLYYWGATMPWVGTVYFLEPQCHGGPWVFLFFLHLILIRNKGTLLGSIFQKDFMSFGIN